MSNVMTAQEIKTLRQKLGLTGDELAKMLGVTGNTVRRWECGVRQAKGVAAVMLERMAKDVEQDTASAR